MLCNLKHCSSFLTYPKNKNITSINQTDPMHNKTNDCILANDLAIFLEAMKKKM